MALQTMHPTKQRLITAGLSMLLERGYNDLGIQALLAATDTPKGSFYHHFTDKEDFALQVVDAYMVEVHAGLDACLQDPERTPLARVRHFFEMTQEKYREQGYMGCLLGGLGQELSGVSEVFRQQRSRPAFRPSRDASPSASTRRARGAISPRTATRGGLRTCVSIAGKGRRCAAACGRTPGSLDAMLDFYFGAVARGAAAE